MFRGRSFDEGSLALGEVLEKKNEILIYCKIIRIGNDESVCG